MKRKELFHTIGITSLAVAVALLPYSTTFCHLFIILFIAASLAEGEWVNRFSSGIRNPFVIPFFIFFVLHLVGMIYTTDYGSGWFDLEKKIFLFALPLVLAVSVPMEKAAVTRLFNVFTISCTIATAICLYYAFRNASHSDATLQFSSLTSFAFYSSPITNLWTFFTYGRLASAITINPSYLAMYLVFCLLWLAFQHLNFFGSYSRIKRISLLLLWFYLSFFIICLSSRIMIIALLALNAFTSFEVLKTNSIRKKLLLSTFVFLLLCGLIYLNPVSRYRTEEVAMTSTNFAMENFQTESVSIRASLWWLGLKAFLQTNPIWGEGTGDVIAVIKKVGQENHISNVLDTYNPHNQFLYTLIGLGGVGFISLLSCLFLPAFFISGSGTYLYLGFIAIFFLLCLTESALEFQKGIAFFSIFNSLLVFQYCNFRLSTKRISS